MKLETKAAVLHSRSHHFLSHCSLLRVNAVIALYGSLVIPVFGAWEARVWGIGGWMSGSVKTSKIKPSLMR